MGSGATPTLVVARGPRAAEEELLVRIERWRREATADPRLLARPVRVVVPSSSLRQHVAARASGRVGAVVGVRVQTLFRVAAEILERAGEPAAPGGLLFPLLVREEARREPELAGPLEPLDDDYAAVAASVADLLDAGITDAPSASSPRASASPRAAALARVALAVRQRLGEQHLLREGDAFARAATLLAADATLLPARAILVHGFADATGVAADLIEALLTSSGGTLIADEPPDPTDSSRTDPGFAFGARFRARIARLARVERADSRALEAPAPELLRAPGTDAEVRAVAQRIAELLDRGVPPEHIGVVARTLDPYVVAIRAQFGRLGIPFSGLAALGPRGASGRRSLAAIEILRLGARVPVDVWLDALDPGRLLARQAPELRLGAHAIGRARLGALAALDVDDALGGRAELPLPTRRGIEVDEEGHARARRLGLRASVLRGANADARELVAYLEAWPAQAHAAEHVTRLRELLLRACGWRDEPEWIARLASELPDSVQLLREDFVLLARELAREEGRPPLGGAGAGVQVVDTTEARARTFESLFVLGLNRDQFPRVVVEDPLLPDAARQAWLPALPDLPLKRLGVDEERFLFAELLASSPAVVLCEQLCDDEGRARSRSPLVAQLQVGLHPASERSVPSLWACGATVPGARPPAEHAVLAGLYASRASFAGALTCALEAQRVAGPAPPELARARHAVLDELDPDRRTPAGALRAREAGPYLGFIGPPLGAEDPRCKPLFVTELEAIARCPWRAFLERTLGIEPVPDAIDVLPGLEPLLVGNVVHSALERLARRVLGERPEQLDELRSLDPIEVPWPAADDLEALALEAAELELRGEGRALPGFARPLARVALRYLLAARERDWLTPPTVLGVEVTGSVSLAGRLTRFKADRLDRAGAELLLTDYKTGKPLEGSTLAKCRTELIGEARRGVRLQAAAYAFGAGTPHAVGRYLWLRPDLDGGPDRHEARAHDAELAGAVESAAAALFDLREAGSFFPRLVDREGKEPWACESCRVAEACLRGDSGVRARLRRLASEREPDGKDAALDALIGVFSLAKAGP